MPLMSAVYKCIKSASLTNNRNNRKKFRNFNVLNEDRERENSHADENVL